MDKLNRKNYAVSDVIGLILCLVIISGAISVTYMWGIPYMDDQKAAISVEGALLQLDAAGDLLDDVFSEGNYEVGVQTFGSSKSMNFKLGNGKMYFDEQGERFVFWYSILMGYSFDVSGFDPDDGVENSFSISDDGTATHADVYYLYKDEDQQDLVLDGTPANSLLHDAVKIDVKNGPSPAGNVVGRIFLFDAGSFIYEVSGSGSGSPISGTYKAIVENGGVLSTREDNSRYFFNEPKYWSQTLLDGSAMLTLKMLQIKKDPNSGVDEISGTGSSNVKLSINSVSSETLASKTQIYGPVKMDIYGSEGAVSAWRFYFKYRMNFEDDDVNDYIKWPYSETKDVYFSLNHAISYVSMEVE